MPDREPLPLPPGLAGAVKLLHGALADAVPDIPIVMGGGSVLAARWRHRDSTDVDLFVSAGSMRTLLDRGSAVTVVGRLRRAGAQADMDPLSGFLTGLAGEVPFSLSASEFILDGRPPSQVIEGTGFQAATNEEVLSGKIKGRLHRTGLTEANAPVRDLYDIVMARHFDPGVVEEVLNGIVPRGRQIIAEGLRQLPDNLHETDAKPLINPTWRIPLHGLPSVVAQAIAEGDESLLPKAEPIAAPTGPRRQRGRRCRRLFGWGRRSP